MQLSHSPKFTVCTHYCRDSKYTIAWQLYSAGNQELEAGYRCNMQVASFNAWPLMGLMCCAASAL